MVRTTAKWALILFFLEAVSASAQARPEITRWPDVSARIDQLYAKYDSLRTPGGVIAVLYRGEVVHLKGYGAANREFGVRWTPETRYRIASITKSFVAYALLRLEQQGKLRLDDPLQKYLPDFPTFDHPLTLHHLLTMRSGLWQDEHLLGLTGLRGQVTIDEMYALSRRQDRLNYTPGSSSSYIDTNFRLLARVLAVVTGQSFPAAMQKLVFVPLEMGSTLADPDMSRVFSDQATTYAEDGSVASARALRIPFGVSGDGAILTTMRDMTLWLRSLRGGPGGALFKRMIAPVAVTDGLGLAVRYRRGIYKITWPTPSGGRIGWGHAGATGTSYIVWPEHDLAVAHFSNNSEIPSLRFCHLITKVVLELRPEIAAAPRDVPQFAWPSAKDVEMFLGTFVEPENGYVIVSEPWDKSLFHHFLGASVMPTRVADGHYEPWPPYSESRVVVTTTECDGCSRPDLLVRHADWPEPRRFVRVLEDEASPRLRAADYTGHYYSRVLGVHYTIESRDEELVLRIGPGIQAAQVLSLKPLLVDCFWAPTGDSKAIDFLNFGFLSIRFLRDADGAVDRMYVSIDKVRDLLFERVTLSSDPRHDDQGDGGLARAGGAEENQGTHDHGLRERNQ